VKNVSVKEFCPPLCFHAKNKKAEVISFTNIDAAAKLLCLLSGLNPKAVMKYLKISFGGDNYCNAHQDFLCRYTKANVGKNMQKGFFPTRLGSRFDN
jgi:hypothetical protein